MKKLLLNGLLAMAMIAVLFSCASGGRPRGPADAFVLTAGSNPGLKTDVTGMLNMQPTPLEVTFVVPPGTDRSRLVATIALNTEAVITVISSGERVVQKNGVTANDFTAPVLYSIEIPKEKKPWRYRVTVREADTNARLGALSFPEGYTLNPAFNPKTAAYTVEVPFATQQVKVSAQAESPYLKSVVIDEKPYAGANVSGSVDFSSVQQRSFTVVTVAEDGVSSQRYTVSIRRGAPDRNASLAALEVVEATLSPAFSPQRKQYAVVLPYTAKEFVIRAEPQSKFAAAALATLGESGEIKSRIPLAGRGSLTDKSGAAVAFSGIDWLPVIVTVTAQDGGVLEYFVEVSRAEPDRNASLAALSVSGGTLSPAFAPKTLRYVVQVLYASKQVAVLAQTQSKVAAAALELGAGSPADLKPQGDLASKEGALLDFSTVDRLPVTVAVTAQDGSVLRYTLDIRRSPPDSNADLAAFTVSSGLLTPPFNPRTVNYTVSVPAEAETVNLTLTTASRVAKVSTDLPVSPSGAAQVITVPTVAGKAVAVNVLITAEDGTEKLYRVNVIRPASLPSSGEPGPRLAGLTVTGAALNPPFNPGLLQYEARIPANVESVVVAARAEGATVVIEGQALPAAGRRYAVAPGASMALPIEVLSAAGAVTRYTLQLSREAQAAAAQPPVSGGLLVAIRNLQVAKREAASLAERKETVGGTATVTVRGYRTNTVLAQAAAPVKVSVQGAVTTLAMEQRLGLPAALPGELVEVEVAIPTSGGRFLCYTEALPAASELALQVPFLLLADNPRIAWPAVGSAVKVAGYLSQEPPGQGAAKRAVESAELEKNAKGEYSLTVKLADAKSGKLLTQEGLWIKPGLPRGRAFRLARVLELPEGSLITWTLTVKTKNGGLWVAEGLGEVWTTAPAYGAGFAPVLLPVVDELSESKP